MSSNSLLLNSSKADETPSRPSAIRQAGDYLVAAISDWSTRRVTRRALLALDDRMLRDIGLSLADVAEFDGVTPRRL